MVRGETQQHEACGVSTRQLEDAAKALLENTWQSLWSVAESITGSSSSTGALKDERAAATPEAKASETKKDRAEVASSGSSPLAARTDTVDMLLHEWTEFRDGPSRNYGLWGETLRHDTCVALNSYR
eukprot:TRINITY_DN91650_c0_g1_i1.p1 TRINITY_DN91650_c0_g1~~TRINITY_DN91650_c0_g1_i1.p1  ORF type:complete len:127 (+),score=30.84 TRINITY_DN91650_c0_g1_i1:157-537(+)